MKVAINCRSFLKKQFTGIGRYTFHLVNSLSEIDSRNEYYLYVRKRLLDFKRQVPQINAKNFTIRMDRFNHGLDKTLGDMDIYHSPSPDDLTVTKARKVIVTVHDLVYKAFPESHTPDTCETTDRNIKEALDKAEKIICISKSTMADLKKYFPGVEGRKLCLIYQGVDKNIFKPLTQDEIGQAQGMLRRKGIEGPFILFVGTIEPRKNLQNLIRALAVLKEKGQFGGKLVVIGMKGWMTDNISILIDGFGLRKDVIFLGFLPNKELRYFYCLAEAFVFPSIYEGFGFPLLEALSCGAAVLTSNASSCPEVAGEAAVFLDPHQPESIADAIAGLIRNENLRAQLQERGLIRAQDFSFLKTAQETLKVYEEVNG